MLILPLKGVGRTVALLPFGSQLSQEIDRGKLYMNILIELISTQCRGTRHNHDLSVSFTSLGTRKVYTMQEPSSL